MSRQQFEEISNLLLAYSAGDYHVKGNISENVDELDMIISGINMLGEELLSTNVSRDFFSGIFNSVSDFVFIADDNGKLVEVNKIVVDTFAQPGEKTLIGRTVCSFVSEDQPSLFAQIKTHLDSGEKKYLAETVLVSNTGKKINGLCTTTKLYDRFGKFNGYLITVKDITEQKEKENLILRTIISTQQGEQKRVADDLHDSLGQELAMAQLMVSNLSSFKVDDPAYMNLVTTCTDILKSSVKHLREICFDLMPSALVKGGLSRGVSELVSRLSQQDQIKTSFVVDEDFPRMNPDLEIAAYRIVQEFLNNMLKHAKATHVEIYLGVKMGKIIIIDLRDNGIGFELSKLESLGENRGVQNIFSKVKAYGGECQLKSKPGEGTQLILQFPLNLNHEGN